MVSCQLKGEILNYELKCKEMMGLFCSCDDLFFLETNPEDTKQAKLGQKP